MSIGEIWIGSWMYESGIPWRNQARVITVNILAYKAMNLDGATKKMMINKRRGDGALGSFSDKRVRRISKKWE